MPGPGIAAPTVFTSSSLWNLIGGFFGFKLTCLSGNGLFRRSYLPTPGCLNFFYESSILSINVFLPIVFSDFFSDSDFCLILLRSNPSFILYLSGLGVDRRGLMCSSMKEGLCLHVALNFPCLGLFFQSLNLRLRTCFRGSMCRLGVRY